MPTLRTWIGHPLEHDSQPDLRRVGIPISASTIGEVLDEASRELSVRFEPHEGPMWFRAFEIPPHEETGWITDICVYRGDEEFYPLRPARDTSFRVEESDVVSIYIVTD